MDMAMKWIQVVFHVSRSVASISVWEWVKDNAQTGVRTQIKHWLR